MRRALSTEQQYGLWDDTDSIWDYALSAQGLLEAAQLLEARYHLVITNVPYLARGKQSDALKAYCERHYPEAKNDLANVFLERCLELTIPPSPSGIGAGFEPGQPSNRPAAGLLSASRSQSDASQSCSPSTYSTLPALV
jgi:hypothetical protein